MPKRPSPKRKSQANDDSPTQIILVRHAHRDNSILERDNGLTKKGREQAKALARLLMRIEKGNDLKLLTSPKRRCLETMAPFARKTKLSLETDDSLLEQMSNETDTQFQERIRGIAQNWIRDRGPYNLIICSHGDLLPLLAQELTGAKIEIQKGAAAWIVKTSDGCKLSRLVRPSEILE